MMFFALRFALALYCVGNSGKCGWSCVALWFAWFSLAESFLLFCCVVLCCVVLYCVVMCCVVLYCDVLGWFGLGWVVL